MPAPEDVQRICTQGMQEVRDRQNTEIAFFGGSFTAIDRRYMISLLDAVQPFLGTQGFSGIRISTRPDAVDEETLELLKHYGVTAIELGAQSMSDEVLSANGRGHTAQDVENASRLIQKYGFSLGLQMMVGLYRSTPEDECRTVQKIVEIHPDTVRIYPVVVLRGTELAERYHRGEYVLFPFELAVSLCAQFLEVFSEQKIAVIKCGLHASEFVEQDAVAGFYHPAFRELCESRIYRKNIGSVLVGTLPGRHTIWVHPSCISKAVGHRQENLAFFASKGFSLKIAGNEKIMKYQCELKE